MVQPNKTLALNNVISLVFVGQYILETHIIPDQNSLFRSKVSKKSVKGGDKICSSIRKPKTSQADSFLYHLNESSTLIKPLQGHLKCT